MKKVFNAVLVLMMFASMSYSASFAEGVLPSSIPNPDEGKFGPENAPIFYIIKTKLTELTEIFSVAEPTQVTFRNVNRTFPLPSANPRPVPVFKNIEIGCENAPLSYKLKNMWDSFKTFIAESSVVKNAQKIVEQKKSLRR
ncbi:MAG: hypothetical protein LBK92_03495 [Endomicrobium sp.]|jgi:hypothetical protein|nr:hypothetical protein [Endomicrobium sp.]